MRRQRVREGLVSRMITGERVRLSRLNVEQGRQRKIDVLEQQGAGVIQLLCTGEFSTLKTQKALLLERDRIIPPLLNAIVPDHTVGIVVPAEEQIVEQANKWRKLKRHPCQPLPGTADEFN